MSALSPVDRLTSAYALLMISTVYGRYHYGVDVFAGVLVGAVGSLVP